VHLYFFMPEKQTFSIKVFAYILLNYFDTDIGYEARHIMSISGHKNEASIRSYSSNVSEDQSRDIIIIIYYYLLKMNFSFVTKRLNYRSS
jgi:hypothetical protein